MKVHGEIDMLAVNGSECTYSDCPLKWLYGEKDTQTVFRMGVQTS